MVAGADFVVLDSNAGPGGAWRHRWDSLTFGRAHAIHDLPGLPLGIPDPAEPAREVVARYYGEYERANELRVVRPVAVENVHFADGVFVVETSRGVLRARTIINSYGTWVSAYVTSYPGFYYFRIPQFHTHYISSSADLL